MNYKEEIKYRDEIIERACNRIKPTAEEHIWLATHPIYNDFYGFPYYNEAIESLNPHKWQTLTIHVESVQYEKRIATIIGVPAGKGKIVADFEVENLRGKKTTGKPIKALGLGLKEGEKESVKYCSDYGLLSVAYECDYYDEKMKLHMRQDSSTGDPLFAMIREVISENKVRYHCKSPLSDTFEAMVFTVEWAEVV